ncbi:MAG: radical SAM protein, partial [Oscillospiraceae bacterium]
GLHPTGELEKNLLAGPYHPAFRELCEGERMLEKLQKQLSLAHPAAGELRVAVHPREVSRMIGQNRRNAQRLSELGWRLKVIPDPGAAPLDPQLIG